MAGLMKECQSVPVAGRLTWGRGEGLENRAVGPPHCTSSRSCCCELGGSADPLSSRAAWSQLCIAMSGKNAHIPLESWPHSKGLKQPGRTRVSLRTRKQRFLHAELLYLTKNTLCLLIQRASLPAEERLL